MVTERAHPKIASLDGCHDDTYCRYCDHGRLRGPESLYESVPASDWHYTSILANGRRNPIERRTWQDWPPTKVPLCCQRHGYPLSSRLARICCFEAISSSTIWIDIPYLSRFALMQSIPVLRI